MPYRKGPVIGEVDAILKPWLSVHLAGEYGYEAVALPVPGPEGETPREHRARLLAQAEDAFDALAAAGLELARLPELEFRPCRDRMELWARFSVRRAG